ncbi:lytic polysaccharide monooxygenase [Mycoavidus sp. HKI]|uniref:lytic polysaccharide monooxygenase auxiliary activity family 9 protein n=1 Tax=Mycoavidus sp. HKI TaxID=2840467 RepID=UPI001CBC61F3|nr:lytic polysaccharide monooxygenase auxiliary activity family 9 protein [Mycoavidus sp. HKI]UAW64952.2 lytic polysaccharide monooxygenase [Mycoavidus sp. HKI]
MGNWDAVSSVTNVKISVYNLFKEAPIFGNEQKSAYDIPSNSNPEEGINLSKENNSDDKFERIQSFLYSKLNVNVKKSRGVAWLSLAGIASGIGGMLQTASAQGAASSPIARQYKCYRDGGFYYPSDGSGIPNAACRAAFLAGDLPDWERPSLFTNWNTVSQNIPNPEAIVELIPDGLLCAGGHSEKRGLDIPNSEWSKTSIIVSKDGRIMLRWDATQVHHDPSLWRVFITKESYDPTTSSLHWSDLEELIINKVVLNSPGPGNASYDLDVTIPSGRSGAAILYSYWQRQDPAHETFFSCSDVTLISTDGTRIKSTQQQNVLGVE